jgi:hypothetical protein
VGQVGSEERSSLGGISVSLNAFLRRSRGEQEIIAMIISAFNSDWR